MFLLELAYRLIIRARNYLYDTGFFKIIKTDAKVISIGNITVGGSGKTPMVIYLSKLLSSQFKQIVIITGGYKRKSKGYKLIKPDSTEYLASDVGDESLLLSFKTNLPVVVDDKKWKAARRVYSDLKPDLILLDDGFQHRKLYRDLDIIIYDKSTQNEKYLIPKGKLREPKNNLNRADILLLRDLDTIDYSFSGSVFNSDYLTKRIYNPINHREYNKSELVNKKVVALSGIAKPKNFIKLLTVNELFIEKHIVFSDHHNYSKKDIDRIIEEAKSKNVDTIITTEKDYVKIKSFIDNFQQKGINILLLELTVEIAEEKGFREEILKRLNE